MTASPAGPSTPPRRLALGEVLRPWGLDGSVVIRLASGDPDRLMHSGGLELALPGRAARAMKPLAARALDGRRVVARFEGIATVEAAEALRGAELTADAGALPEPEPGSWYAHQLLGAQVVTLAGEILGVVAAIEDNGGQDLLAVRGDDGAETLIPFVPAICREVDADAGRIVVDPPAGLLELTRQPGGGE